MLTLLKNSGVAAGDIDARGFTDNLGIANLKKTLCCISQLYAGTGEAANRAVFDNQGCAGLENNAAQLRPHAVEVEIAQDDRVCCPGANDDAPGSRNVSYGAAIDGYGLRDCDHAKAAGIEYIDLATRGGLGYRTRETPTRSVRLHGFASSPTPDTKVRAACAYAEADKPSASSIASGKITPLSAGADRRGAIDEQTSRTREVSFEPDRCRIAPRDAMSKIDIPNYQRTALSGFESF
jgi:hypothetical protein